MENNIIETKKDCELKLCACGCGQTVINKKHSFINREHYNKKHSIIFRAKPEDVVICACGCGQQIQYQEIMRYKGWPTYINGHQNNIRKGKTNVEVFGEELAQRMAKKPEGFGIHNTIQNTGKTMLERMGNNKEKYDIAINKIKTSMSRSYEEKYGKEKADILKQRLSLIHLNAPKKGRTPPAEYTKICACGCGKVFKTFLKNTKFWVGHQNRDRNKDKALPDDIKICECGCGEQIIWNETFRHIGWPRYINLHQNNVRKGKTYEEIYGEELAQQMRDNKPESFGEDVSKRQQGVSMLERIGDKEKYDIFIEKMKSCSSCSYEERWGKEIADKVRLLRAEARLGKTYIDLFGPEKTLEICKKQGEKDGWGRGKNETFILDEIEKIINYTIDRNYWVYVSTTKKLYKPDGYVKELNLFIEIDENYHRYQEDEDMIREQDILLSVENSEFIRVDEKNVMSNLQLLFDMFKNYKKV